MNGRATSSGLEQKLGKSERREEESSSKSDRRNGARRGLFVCLLGQFPPLPLGIEKRDDSSQILPTHSYPIRGARFTERLRNVREKGEGNCRLQQMSGNFEASRGTRRGNDRLSANFNQQEPEAFDENVRNGWP